MASFSNTKAEEEIEEAANLAYEIRGMTEEVEKNLLPKMEESAYSEEMEITFRCIDNFLEKVLPALGRDLDMLEKVVGSLELHSNSKTKPINSFLKGLIGANDEIPTISNTVVGGYKDLQEGERLIKFCNELKIQDEENLLDMMHGPSNPSSLVKPRSIEADEDTTPKSQRDSKPAQL